jgi:molybdopterin-containing oxidoreductase family iron-sulfur binding subunit
VSYGEMFYVYSNDTQKTILDAKRDGRPVVDGGFQTACSNACTSGAMTLVMLTIPNVSTKLADESRMYHFRTRWNKINVIYHVKS